jgi:hypothetical protein
LHTPTPTYSRYYKCKATKQVHQQDYSDSTIYNVICFYNHLCQPVPSPSLTPTQNPSQQILDFSAKVAHVPEYASKKFDSKFPASINFTLKLIYFFCLKLLFHLFINFDTKLIGVRDFKLNFRFKDFWTSSVLKYDVQVHSIRKRKTESSDFSEQWHYDKCPIIF